MAETVLLTADFTLDVVADVRVALAEDGFGRGLLYTLTDSIESVCEAFDGELPGYRVIVQFTRRRNPSSLGL
ncbi:hypothetical protein [Nocardia heshunensis]